MPSSLITPVDTEVVFRKELRMSTLPPPLPQQPDQKVLSVLAGASIRQSLATGCGQSEHVVHLAIGEQSPVGGDHRTAKPEH